MFYFASILESIMKLRELILPAVALYLLYFSSGCSYFANFYQPLSPHEQMTADIWPVLSAAQKKEISALTTTEEVATFIKNFWKERDPTPGTEINEFEQVYKARLDYVHEHYPYKRGWTHSDRARIYLIYGPPDDVYNIHWVSEPNLNGPNLNVVEVWVYNIFVADINPPTIFDKYDLSLFNPNLMQFFFADLIGCGRYTQIYSNVPGEKIDPRVYIGNSSGFIF